LGFLGEIDNSKKILSLSLIIDDKLKVEAHENVKDAIIQAQTTQRLKKEFSVLESKLFNEKQFNIQLKLSEKLKTLKADLNKLNN